MLADHTGRIRSAANIPTPATIHEIDYAIHSLCILLAESAKVPFSKVNAIGIGSAGVIDSSRGIVRVSPNIPAWKDYPLAKKIESLTHKKVFLDNDANIAVRGELWTGKGSQYSNWVMLTLGTGIGGGAIIDGKLYTGQSGFAAELGHMTILPDGEKCPCGNNGCLERYASAAALIRHTQRTLDTEPGESILRKATSLNAHVICEAARKKDHIAVNAVHQLGIHLGVGIANLLTIFNPEAVIIGGGLSGSMPLYRKEIAIEIKKRVMLAIRKNVSIIQATDRRRGPSLGAARYAMERYLQ